MKFPKSPETRTQRARAILDVLKVVWDEDGEDAAVEVLVGALIGEAILAYRAAHHPTPKDAVLNQEA